MTKARDYAAEYRAACVDDRTPGRTLHERGKAQARMQRIYSAAVDAGVDLPIYEIDEAVRIELYGADQ